MKRISRIIISTILTIIIISSLCNVRADMAGGGGFATRNDIFGPSEEQIKAEAEAKAAREKMIKKTCLGIGAVIIVAVVAFNARENTEGGETVEPAYGDKPTEQKENTENKEE